MAEQDDRQAALAFQRNAGQGGHVLDQRIPSTDAEIAQRLFRGGGATVPSMIVGIDMEARLVEEAGEVAIAKRMLAHPVRYLNDADRLTTGGPSIAGDRDGLVV